MSHGTRDKGQGTRDKKTPQALIEGVAEWDYIAAPEAVVQKVCETIERFRMLNDGEGIVLGVSGGPDSVTLLHILHRLSKEKGYRLHAAHLNHQLRGVESDGDARFVVAFCQKLGVSCTVRSVNVASLAKEWKLSVPQAGRRARYEFFKEVAQAQGCTKLALGHTADDVVETVLINLFRGTGLEGLIGIPPVSEGWIVRPLIACTRKETQLYAKVYRLNPRMDSSNLDTKHLRNWIRLELLPLVRQRFSENVDEAILRLVELVRAELEFLQEKASVAFLEAATEISPQCVILDREKMLAQPLSVRRWVLRKAFEHLKGPLHGVSLEHIEEVIGLVERHHSGAQLSLPQKMTAKLERGKLIIWHW